MESEIDSNPNVMRVYQFSRSDSEIQQELSQVFSSRRGTPGELWSAQAEQIVEPVDWIALWKLSKQFCKKFEVRFPCIAYVTVVNVNFGALAACVEVLSVQHESVSLPESVEDVPLVELWPTTQQRKQGINEASTADFIHLLRFFYTNIWMPWDERDDELVQPKAIEDRMQLWMDLKNGAIPSCAARTISLLRTSAVNAYEQVQELDSSLFGGVPTDDDDYRLSASQISLYAELYATLDGLMCKWMLYEDSRVREQTLDKERSRWQKQKNQKNVVALWQGGSISDFTDLTKFLRGRVSDERNVNMDVSAEAAIATEPEELIVCSPEYEFPEMPLSQISLCSFKGAKLRSPKMRTCLLMLSENCVVRDLSLQCALVNTVVIMRAGTLHMINCQFYDDSNSTQSEFAQGILADSGSKILLENCTFDNFYSGIVVNTGAEVELRNCTIRNCGVGIQLYAECEVVLDNTSIADCSEHCVRCELGVTATTDPNSIQELQITPNCRIGSGDLGKEILVVPQYGHSL